MPHVMRNEYTATRRLATHGNPIGLVKRGELLMRRAAFTVNDEILRKQGQTRLAALAYVSPCLRNISEQSVTVYRIFMANIRTRADT